MFVNTKKIYCRVYSRTSGPKVFYTEVFLNILQDSQENACIVVSFLIKLQAWGLLPAALLKKWLQHRCFNVNFVKFLRTPFFIVHLRWLLHSLYTHLHNDMSRPCPCVRKIFRKKSTRNAAEKPLKFMRASEKSIQATFPMF